LITISQGDVACLNDGLVNHDISERGDRLASGHHWVLPVQLVTASTVLVPACGNLLIYYFERTVKRHAYQQMFTLVTAV